METRISVRCKNCNLVQFETAAQLCRRCGLSYAPPPPPPIELPPPNHIDNDLALLASVAKTIKHRRQQVGLSQRALAKKMKCQRTYISKIESQGTMPTLNSLDRLAIGLNTSMSSLISDIESRRLLIQLQTAVTAQTPPA